MRKAMILFTVLIFAALAAKNITLQQNPGLGHYLHEEEIGKSLERDFYPTAPPAIARNIAEFEPMEGVLIRYPFGLSYSLIASLSQQDKVVTIVQNTSQQNTVTNTYQNYGVNLANCEFLLAGSDSYWCRDYGPWYIYDGEEVAIVNFIYNRPRPNDNDIPIEMANFLGITLYGMPVEHTGGNYMTDGCGVSASSYLVYDENPGLTEEEVDEYMQEYLGINSYHVLEDPNNTYIDHIDCWGKFLAVDKVLIREVPSSHAQYDEIEATAAYFAAQNCAWGYPYEVFRVFTPGDQPYTNSLILNKRVFVPVTGSGWDDEALAVYEQALPGYEVLGFTGSWYSTDALHCRTKGIADRNMVHIAHTPFWQEQIGGQPLQFSAQITACSEEELLADSVYIAWRLEADDWNYAFLNYDGNNWSSQITLPAEPGEFEYYLKAQDVANNSVTHPLTGQYAPHHFTLLQGIAYGDIDENGNVESYDAALLLQYVVGLDPLPELDPLPWDMARLTAADVDGSGELDSYDASLIMQYFVNLIEIFPVEE